MKNKTKTDPEFTKLLGEHMLNAKGFFEYGVKHGLTSPEDLRLTVTKRVEVVQRLKDSGMSQRKIAKAVGVSQSQVHIDLKGDQKLIKNDQKLITLKPSKAVKAEDKSYGLSEQSSIGDLFAIVEKHGKRRNGDTPGLTVYIREYGINCKRMECGGTPKRFQKNRKEKMTL